MDGVHLKQGLVDARDLSSLGDKLLQDNRLDNALFSNERERCDAVVHTAINHVHLLASVLAPYVTATTRSILSQLETTLLTIPDEYLFDSISGGHAVGKAQHLFQNSKPEKEKEWRELFGGTELKKQKEEAEAKKAARRAEKDRKKAKKADEKEGQGAGVKTVEKDGVQSDPKAGEVVDEVTKGVAD